VDREHDEAALEVLTQVGLLGPVRRAVVRCTAPDLHAGAAAAVWHLAEHGPQRMSELAAGLQVDVSVVSRQVAELVTAGHLVRQPDPEDGRACLLSVTPAGRVVLDAAVERLAARFLPQLAGWDTEELRRVAADLRRLGDALLRASPAGAPPAPART